MKQDYIAGEFITDFSYIYQVTSVKMEGEGDKKEVYLHYKPMNGSDKAFTASIPVRNMKKSGTRKVFEKSEVVQVKKDLCNMCLEMEYNTQIGREAIYQNDPQKVITVLKYLWTNKENEKMSNADKELMEQILSQLCKEISFVTEKPYLKVRKEIEVILGEDKKVSN